MFRAREQHEHRDSQESQELPNSQSWCNIKAARAPKEPHSETVSPEGLCKPQSQFVSVLTYINQTAEIHISNQHAYLPIYSKKYNCQTVYLSPGAHIYCILAMLTDQFKKININQSR